MMKTNKYLSRNYPISYTNYHQSHTKTTDDSLFNQKAYYLKKYLTSFIIIP